MSGRPARNIFWLGLAAVLVITAAGLGYFAAQRGSPTPPPLKQPLVQTATPQDTHGLVMPVGPDLRTLALAVDQAILNALQDTTPPTQELRILVTRPLADPMTSLLAEHGAAMARFHELSARTALTPADLAASLSKTLAPAQRAAQVQVQDGLVTVVAYGTPLRSIRLLPLPKLKPKQAPLFRTQNAAHANARISIVLDDLGDDIGYARKLLKLDVPIVMAIWPYGRFAAKVARESANAGRQVIAHVPMEPMSYPRQNPGPGTLFADMDDDDLTAALVHNIQALPHIVGINNHMGSRVTASKRAMLAILTELKSRNLFFLDSVTTAKSQAVPAAKEVGITTFKRDVFLDNEQDVEKILSNLRRTEKIARKYGQAVAIGHPHPETLQALTQWVQERDTSIAVVPVSDLRPVVKAPAQQTPPQPVAKTPEPGPSNKPAPAEAPSAESTSTGSTAAQ
ncbi:MAG: hypothetical protein F6K39_06300 [Okeania sp. SIO3B3]|nr:hypothetical protein [Okeania sp. SIO3B3]